MADTSNSDTFRADLKMFNLLDETGTCCFEKVDDGLAAEVLGKASPCHDAHGLSRVHHGHCLFIRREAPTDNHDALAYEATRFVDRRKQMQP
jgi:hypothetical protein